MHSRQIAAPSGPRPSDGVTFPSGTAVKVSKDQAEQACAGLTDQKANCVTDLRMVNEPAAVEKIAQDFEQVETTVTNLKVVGQLVVDGATTKHFCWSALALIIGLMLNETHVFVCFLFTILYVYYLSHPSSDTLHPAVVR